MASLLSTRPGLGAPAPPLELPTPDGQPRSIEEFRGRPVVVSFLGPANCQFCRAHLLRMVQARDRLAQLGAEVLLVAHQDPELMMSQMLRDLALPFVLLVDPQRQAYARWGLGEATYRVFLVPSLYAAILKMVLRRPPPLGEAPESRQMGGDFVVDRTGRLAFVNRMRSLHDRAPVTDLLAAAERV